jgi:hypothetical protein
MKTQFLGEHRKKLKNATEKYNIPMTGLSPFMTKSKGD